MGKVKINHPLIAKSWERLARTYHRRSNPIMPNMTDLIIDYEWDKNVTAAAANTLAQYTFFNVPIGAGAPVKTKNETSLEQVSVLTAPEWMNVWKLGFYFCPAMVMADIATFLNNYYFEFWVGNKIYAQGPLSCAPSGFGVMGTTTRNNEGTYALGGATQGGVPNVGFDLRLPAGFSLADGTVTNGLMGVTILQSQTFTVKVFGLPFALQAAAAPMNGTGLSLECFLYGIKSRGVQ